MSSPKSNLLPSSPLPVGTHRQAPLQALSISRPVSERLSQAGPVLFASVLAVFDRACHLVTPGGDAIALVLPHIGDGPLNIVIEGQAHAFSAVERGTSASLQDRHLCLGDLSIALDGAAVWEPCPDWSALRVHRAAITGHLPLLHALALEQAPAGSLLHLTAQKREAGCQPAPPMTADGFTQALASTLSQATVSLTAGWRGDHTNLVAGAAQLAGLGTGLTPAGDDFLAGLMTWAWLAHPTPRSFCRALLDATAPRTTVLSAAFLQAAAGGECSIAWHRLLAGLSDTQKTLGVPEALRVSLQGVLSHGHTSGADMLAGFLSLARPEP
jgi:hypothetical protein